MFLCFDSVQELTVHFAFGSRLLHAMDEPEPEPPTAPFKRRRVTEASESYSRPEPHPEPDEDEIERAELLELLGLPDAYPRSDSE